MRAERRADGSLVVRDDPWFLRAALLVFGVAIQVAVWTASPHEPLKLALGALGSLLCLVPVATLERISFELDPARRTLRWSRRNLFRRLGGEVPFHEIDSIDVRMREDREREGVHVRIDRSWRIEIATRSGGVLQVTHRTFPDEASQNAIAGAMRESLGLPPQAATAETVESLVAGGELIAAVRLARATRGLSLEEAKQLVDELRAKLNDPESR